MVTSEIKDKILSEFKEAPQKGEFNMHEFASELNLELHLVASIFDEFVALGLMDIEKTLGLRRVNFRINALYFDFVRSGGFTAREKTKILENKQLEFNVQLLEIELNKLKSEIESVKNTNPTLAERMLAIMSNIASITGVSSQFI